MVTSTGLQALLSSLYRNVDETGLREADEPIRRLENPAAALPPTPPVAGNSPSLSFTVLLSLSSNGGEEMNSSFNLRLTRIFSFFLLPLLSISGDSSAISWRSGEPARRENPRRSEVRLSSIRKVLRRRRWITGLVVGLRVGLPATAHWVASSLNFCRVAIPYRWSIDRGNNASFTPQQMLSTCSLLSLQNLDILEIW